MSPRLPQARTPASWVPQKAGPTREWADRAPTPQPVPRAPHGPPQLCWAGILGGVRLDLRQDRSWPLLSKTWNLKNVLWSGLSFLSDSAEGPAPAPAWLASSTQGCSLRLPVPRAKACGNMGPAGKPRPPRPCVPAGLRGLVGLVLGRPGPNYSLTPWLTSERSRPLWASVFLPLGADISKMISILLQR